jgi:hypothetical protein
MRPIASRCLVAVSLLTLGGMALAAVTYRWVDAQGVVHYSDQPHPGAEVIQLTGAQTYHGTSPGASSAAASPAPPAPPAAAGYQSCSISQPAAEASLYAPDAVAVLVQVSPALRAGDQISVTADGAVLQPLSADGLTYQVSQPERGTHSLSAQVRSSDGTVVCSSPAVTFYVQRPSINTPGSPVKPH